MKVPLVRHISPKGFLIVSANLLVFFAIVHLLGWREYADFMTGNIQSSSEGAWRVFKGLMYIALYFGAAVFVPILIIASGLFYVLASKFLRIYE